MTNKAKIITGCCALLLAACSARADEPNIVANGGFETGDFSGWTITGNAAYSQVGTINWGYDHANSGSDYAMLGSYGELSDLSQNLPTNTGSNYTLTFDLASDGDQTNEFSVAIGGTTLFDQVNLPQMDYTQYTFHFVATSDSTPLTFGSRDDAGYLLLDDVSVVDPPPENGIPGVSGISAPLPASVWMGAVPMAAMGLLGLRRRVALA